MPNRSSKPPADPNQAAKSILDRINDDLSGVDPMVRKVLKQISDSGEPQPQKNPAAQELGRLGGLKGGKARAESMTPEQRKEVAKKAAEARWSKKD